MTATQAKIESSREDAVRFRNVVSRLIQFFLVVAVAFAAHAQQPSANVTVRAILVDQHLTQKPVPRLPVQLTPSAGGDPIELRTSFEGVAQADIPPGEYHLKTGAIPFEGKTFSWNQTVSVSGPTTIDLSNDNASVAVESVQPARRIDELTTLYSRLKNSVATVWSELGHGTGFFVDDGSLIVTNDHVIGTSNNLAVQFDERRKIKAVLLARDEERDVAVLKIDRTVFSEALPAPLANVAAGAPVIEGERVFTIGSPLNQRKVVTSGVVSKVETRAIISDININPGNSGGPLFNSLGEVVGVTTFGEPSRGVGHGISGIVRLEEALPTIEAARGKSADAPIPDGVLLPVDPMDKFPLDAIKAAVEREKFDMRPYLMTGGGFDMAVITPVTRYRMQYQEQLEAARQKSRRNRKSAQAVQGTFKPLENLRNWAEYAGEYKPVILIQARPQLREGFWSAFGRGLAASQGMYAGPANLAFRTDFYRMELTCGAKVVQPIHAGKSDVVISEDNAFVRVKDATYEGLYVYAHDAIAPACGAVVVRVFSEKTPNTPVVEVLTPATINRVWMDFEPYRRHLALASK